MDERDARGDDDLVLAIILALIANGAILEDEGDLHLLAAALPLVQQLVACVARDADAYSGSPTPLDLHNPPD